MIRFLLLFLLTFKLLFASSTVISENITKNFSIEYFYDKNSKLDINSISNKEFKENIPSQFTLGYIEGASWLKITLLNTHENKDFIISLIEPFYKKANLFHLEKDKWVKEKNGFDIALQDRSIKYKYPSFKIYINKNQTKTYYIQLETSFAHFGEVKIFTPESFQLEKENNLILYMFYFGGIFIIFVFILFMFFVLKERIYFYYSTYIFWTIIFIFVLSGTHLNTIFYDYTLLLHSSAPLILISLIFFSDSFLDIKKYSSNSYKVFTVLIPFLIILTILINIDHRTWYRFITILASFTFILLCYVSIIAWIKGFKQAKYYLLIIMFYTTIMAIFTSMVNSWIPNNDFTRYSFLFAIYVEVLFFSLMLANRFKLMQDKTILVQKKIIEENIEDNTILEEKVAQRTNEISLLLKEVYHRVKNNFQVVIALLWLEAQKIPEDNKEKKLLLELTNKIKSMSTLHQLLYESKDLSSIDSEEYILKIVREYKNIYSKHNIQVFSKIESMRLNIDQSISLGSIINEILSNAIKHHNDKDNCVIDISLNKDESQNILTIIDNGVGFEDNVETDSLGLKLIKQFSSKLSNARYDFIKAKGTHFILRFDNT